MVLKNGERLCGRCRLPLAGECLESVEATLAESRDRATRVGSAQDGNSRLRDNDPDWVPPEHRSRHHLHPSHMSDRDVEKFYADHAAEMRTRGKGKNGRILASIPPELHMAKLKVDRDYWKDEKNLRKHKDFLVHD